MVRKLRIRLTPKFFYLEKYIMHIKKESIMLLDVGCGNKSPSITKSLFPTIEYYGLDKEEYNITENDKQILKDHFFNCDLDNLEDLDKVLPDSMFDFVIMNHVIEHTRNGLKILEILSKKIKPGGGIYIEFPSVKSLSLPSMKGTLNFCDDPTHVRVYTIPEICNVLLDNGFKIVKAGRRRNIFRILVMPLLVLRGIIDNRYMEASIFWDLFGFADFCYAIKQEN